LGWAFQPKEKNIIKIMGLSCPSTSNSMSFFFLHEHGYETNEQYTILLPPLKVKSIIVLDKKVSLAKEDQKHLFKILK
jgi:hypothetical protein